MGEVFRKRCPGYAVWILSGNPLLEEAIGLEPTAVIPLYNGRIPCRLLRYELT